MKKMSTLYEMIYHDNHTATITENVREENRWVFEEEGVLATRKFDGTACAIIDGEIYRRYDAKNGKKAPEGAIPCCEADPITGHHPHWVKCDRTKKMDRYHFEAFDKGFFEDGTYELVGPKLQGNPERFDDHVLVTHGGVFFDIADWSFEGFKTFLSNPKNDIEGIVFHGKDGKMCKLRKADFGIKR